MDNLTAQALDISLKYNFVTPLTSMVVTKPEDEKNNEPLIADKPPEGEEVKPAYSVPSYSSGPSYRASSPVYSVDSDPHFIIHVPQRNDSLCFNINEEPGVVLNLVKDPIAGITVNGQLIGDKKTSNGAKISNSTYFGKIGIVYKMLDLKIEITPQKIIVRNGKEMTMFSWLDTVSMTQDSLTLVINKKKNMMVSTDEGATFVIILHQVWQKHPLHQDYLGFYTVDSHMFSKKAHGLLGQFFHGIDFDVFDIHPSADPEKPDATMIVKKQKITVTRGWQRDYRKDPKIGSIVPCWFVHFNGTGLIDGDHTDYIVPNLFSTM